MTQLNIWIDPVSPCIDNLSASELIGDFGLSGFTTASDFLLTDNSFPFNYSLVWLSNDKRLWPGPFVKKKWSRPVQCIPIRATSGDIPFCIASIGTISLWLFWQSMSRLFHWNFPRYLTVSNPLWYLIFYQYRFRNNSAHFRSNRAWTGRSWGAIIWDAGAGINFRNRYRWYQDV